ncbi:hypothetical protein LDENG_00112910 [Lucifuga dentata]|nr:hypothetical protein LDENG_00112910 [Lucifuga dentata]
MDRKQLEVNPRIRAALRTAKLKSVRDILSVSGPDLQCLTGLSHTDVQQLLTAASKACRGRLPTPALHLQHGECGLGSSVRLSLGCPVLDGLLRGGLPYPPQHGGLNAGAVYICTEDSFPIRRLQQLIGEQAHLRSEVPPPVISRIPFSDHVYVEHAADLGALQACLARRVPLLLARGMAKLLVVDSVAAVFRTEFQAEDWLERTRQLLAFAATLHHLSYDYEYATPVLCINQVTDVIDSSDSLHDSFGPLNSKVSPALGLSWANQVMVRLMMHRLQRMVSRGDQSSALRRLEVVFAPHLARAYWDEVSTLSVYRKQKKKKKRSSSSRKMIKSKADEEDYWHSSKFKAFTFDDEDDEFSRLKESKRAVNSIRPLMEEDDDEDDVEKVSWSGEPVGSISWSIRETAMSSQRTAEPSFPKINANTPTIPKSNSGYSLSSLFKGKTKSGSFQSFSDSLGDSSVRLYAPELRKPKSEYQDYISDWTPEETVQRMQQGKVVSLEKFRSLQDKLLLLDHAVAAHDGNVITAVLICLKKTLSTEVLFRELESRQTALSHFIHFLSESREQRLLLDLLRTLGRTEDMALLQYKEHLSIADENKRRDFLKSCVSLPFSAEDAAHVQDHYTLLERQIIIEATDRLAERGGKSEIFQKFPRRASILNMPLITTLYYCCFYHYTEPEGTYSSPANVRQTFRISEKQLFVTALAARAKLKAWSDVDTLFTSRNWLGFTRKKSPISFQRVVDILQKNNAPTQVLQDYVGLVDDTDLRISLAQKHKCHDIVINTYRDLKDRQQLLGYRGKVERGSVEERKIDELISNPQIRWKN